ncbi:MAG: PilC/PilY family type IV pilus protein, partial [Thiohalophilus sp.]
RNRDILLGDIVNSDPWFVGRSNFGYGLLPGVEGDDYAAFIASSSYINRTEALYVGAKDGMLHAVDAATGAELFTYIPSSVYTNLASLADKNYNHKYFVDGSPRAGAAYIDVGTGSKEWRTVLLGSTGAGGRTVFALDVTDPSTFDESDILWEFTNPELGYTLGQPTIVRLATGDWAAVFGNGYNSNTQSSRIFIVNIEDGSLIYEFDSGVGDATDPNGMATPIVSDSNQDGIADIIHAGDLHGNLWSIDISNTNSGQWGSNYKQGNTPKPLFVATSVDGNRQPITAKPQVGNDPNGGLMVYFGTGKYIEAGDNIVPATPEVNSIYGIRDNGSTSVRSDLLQQEIIYEEDLESFTNPDTGEVFTNGVRLMSQNTMTTQPGWYLDLISPAPNNYGRQGERVASTPLLWDDRIIFPTLIPNDDPCGWGGDSWLMEFDRLTGGRLNYTVFDLNRDNRFDSQEWVNGMPVSGVKSKEGIIDTPGVVCADKTCFKYSSGSSGDVEVVKNKGGTTSGRQTWMQLQ